MIRILEKIRGGWLFLFIISSIYLVVSLIKFNLAKESFLVFLSLCWKILPILVLVFGLIFLLNLFLEQKAVLKYLGESSGIKGWIIAIITGILCHGPIYMWYPLLADLSEKGMRTSFVATFLYNRAVKIPLIPLMIYYFGWLFVLILSIYMIIFSVINGVVVEKILK